MPELTVSEPEARAPGQSQSAIGNRKSEIGLRTQPHSSTARQHQTLVIAGQKRGMDLAEVRRTVGGSLRALSAADASRWIKLFTNRDLPNPPGGKLGPYQRRDRSRDRSRDQSRDRSRERKRPDGEGKDSLCLRATPRIITPDHIEQIGRLMLQYFAGNVLAAQQWFRKTWHVQEPADLLDTEQAGKVIKVLKDMVKRKEGAK